MKTDEIRDLIIKILTSLKSAKLSKINGNYFVGVDVAVRQKDGKDKVFRIAVLPKA